MQSAKLNTYLETGRVIFLPAKAIRPNPTQPRRSFDPAALEELTQSIRRHGILQPLSVRRVGMAYELIAGERRLRAGILAGLKEIPCIVLRMDERESAVAALVENLQRQDLDFLEQARGIARLMELCNLNQEQAAQRLGISQSAVANKLRLLRHSPPVLQAISKGDLSERHARALLRLPTEADKLAAIEVILRQNLSVTRTEQYITQQLSTRERRPPREQNTVGSFLTNLTQSLTKIQLSGVPATTHRQETDSAIVLTITIPKQ